MGYNNPDPYNQPEHFGLKPVATVDWLGDEACYEFSVTEVWFHPESRQFYWADDSGCSCNAPFEYFDEDDLHKGSWSQCINSLQSNLHDNTRPEVRADVVAAIEAILRTKNE